LLGALPLSGFCATARAQDEKPDEAVVAALVDIVKDKEQSVERRIKASEKLGELKVQDKEAVKVVAALLDELWPSSNIKVLGDKRNYWVIAVLKRGNLTSQEVDKIVEPYMNEPAILTKRIDGLSKILTAMGGAEAAEPTLRKALALHYAAVEIDDAPDNPFRPDVRPVRLKAPEYLVALKTPTAVTAIRNEVNDEAIGPQAIEALGKLKAAEAIPSLTEALVKSKSVKHRRAAAVALGAIGSAKGLPALKAAEAVEEDKECLSAIRDAIKALEAGGK
jgi:HEAT repeat protein